LQRPAPRVKTSAASCFAWLGRAMSRIGRIPINLPDAVSCEIKGDTVAVGGPKGKLSMRLPMGINVVKEGKQLKLQQDLSVRMKKRHMDSRHGLARALVYNMVKGVMDGYERKVEMMGAGYRPQVQANKLVLTLGFSHPVTVNLPEGVKITAERVEGGARGEERHMLKLTGCDKALLGELASEIRRIRPMDVYKGKGVRHFNEVVRRKPGKATVGAGGTGGK